MNNSLKFEDRMMRRKRPADIMSIAYSLLLRARNYRQRARDLQRIGHSMEAMERRFVAVDCYRTAWELSRRLPHGAGLLRKNGPFALAA